MQNKATELFSYWAEIGKDKGMAEAHSPAVNQILRQALAGNKSHFNFIDAGCGNGWVVRKVREMPLCLSSCGIDGAKGMIENARRIDPGGDYYLADLLSWSPTVKAELIFSMEVFYYFKFPEELTRHIVDNWLAPYGRLIIGIDHYTGNPDSHSWPEDLNVHMTLKDAHEWVQLFMKAGLSNCTSSKANISKRSPGTLVVSGDLIL